MIRFAARRAWSGAARGGERDGRTGRGRRILGRHGLFSISCVTIFRRLVARHGPTPTRLRAGAPPPGKSRLLRERRRSDAGAPRFESQPLRWKCERGLEIHARKGFSSKPRRANGDLLDIAHGVHDRDGLFSGDNPHVELPKDFGSFRREARKLALQRL
jgi:hypothetical protein